MSHDGITIKKCWPVPHTDWGQPPSPFRIAYTCTMSMHLKRKWININPLLSISWIRLHHLSICLESTQVLFLPQSWLPWRTVAVLVWSKTVMKNLYKTLCAARTANGQTQSSIQKLCISWREWMCNAGPQRRGVHWYTHRCPQHWKQSWESSSTESQESPGAKDNKPIFNGYQWLILRLGLQCFSS